MIEYFIHKFIYKMEETYCNIWLFVVVYKYISGKHLMKRLKTISVDDPCL